MNLNKTNKYYQIYDLYSYLKNKDRYKGNLPITCRSSWEINFILKFLDKHPNVIEWSSESIVIPYFYEVDKKIHRYFIDFSATIKDKDGNLQKYLIEIKPYKQTKEPSKKSKNYLHEMMEYIKNKNKWSAAEIYAQERGMKFLILTEKDLYN